MTAQLTFTGGGLLLPASTPYDRQMLREYAVNLVRANQQITIAVDAETWVVESASAAHPMRCRRCKQQPKAVVLHRAGRKTCYCIGCAL